MTQGFYVESSGSAVHTSVQEVHVESPERLLRIREALQQAGLLGSQVTITHTEEIAAPTPGNIGGASNPFPGLDLVHSTRYLRKLQRACDMAPADKEYYVDSDTYVTRETPGLLRTTARNVTEGVDFAMRERGFAFCAVRPPGHHAGREYWGGFCVANFSAYAAQYARSQGVENVAIIDWDAHHGNGTQSIFYTDPNVFYLSLHASGIFPPGGTAKDRGKGAGKGYTYNVSLPAGIDDDDYIERFNEGLTVVRDHMNPGMIIVSAGFDAHRDDPLGALGLSSEVFGTLTERIKGNWNVPIVSVLEGGYNLKALGESVVSHVVALTK
jgi:acetoin utilization deacetylase AcuC-like enzyme